MKLDIKFKYRDSFHSQKKIQFKDEIIVCTTENTFKESCKIEQQQHWYLNL